MEEEDHLKDTIEVLMHEYFYEFIERFPYDILYSALYIIIIHPKLPL